MPAREQDIANGPLTRAQVLDELEVLATVEHALVVEYLSVCCALGHDLKADEGGATTDEGKAAVSAASALAQSEMFHLKGVDDVLVSGGRSAQLGRATSISSVSTVSSVSDIEIALGPPSLAALERLVDRGAAIASAVDERYGRLLPAVTSAPVFDGQLLDQLRSVIDHDGTTHAAAFATLRDALGDVAPAGILRATRRDPADAFEERLLGVSDKAYGLVLDALRDQFAQQDFLVSGSFRGLAVSAMQEVLDTINRLLVQRGLLPSFTMP